LEGSYHCKPRFTQDIDFLFSRACHYTACRSRFHPHSTDEFRHDRTPGRSARRQPVIDQCSPADPRTSHSYRFERIRVATASGLVALKLFGLRVVQDEADVVALIKTEHIDLSNWSLPPEKVIG
jgi:hypothetical protein